MNKKKVSKKKAKKNKELKSLKIISIGFITSVVFVALFFRIIHINYVHGHQAEQEIIQLQLNRRNNRRDIVQTRGSIYDRNMRILASSYSVYDVTLDVRRMVEDNKEGILRDERKLYTLTTIGYHLDIPLEVMKSHVEVAPDGSPVNDTHRLVIARDVNVATVTALRQAGVRYHHAEEVSRRNYPHNNLAAQTIGFIRHDNMYGLENSHNRSMVGRPGRSFDSVQGRNEIVQNIVPAEHGYSIVTNIDLSIQQYAETAVSNAVEQFNPQKASAIVMNPQTGEILAMAQYPNFNLNHPTNFDYMNFNESLLQVELEEVLDAQLMMGLEQPMQQVQYIEQIELEQLELTTNNTIQTQEVLNNGVFNGFMYNQGEVNPNIQENTQENIQENISTPQQLMEEDRLRREGEVLSSVWTNFNTSYTWEPGSIFKPMIIAAAIDEGVISTQDVFYCPGYIIINGTRIPCWNRTGHGLMDVTQAIAYSCNVSVIKISQAMGRSMFYNYMREFGMGQMTGIDLPNEVSASTLLYSEAQLNPVEIATNSMGQGFNSTAIQQLVAFSALINGGYIVRPFVVGQIIDENGHVVYENSPTKLRKVISTDTSDFMRTAMLHTISDYGTGHRAQIQGYAIGGKTGTAQQGRPDDPRDQQYTVSFIGYMQEENPDIVVMVVIHLVDYYTVTASYMLQEIMLNIINHRNIAPTRPTDGTVTTNSYQTMVMEDFVGHGVSHTVNRLNRIGMDFNIIDTGGNYIRSQMPSAGVTISSDTRVYLMTGTSLDAGELRIIPEVTGASVSQAVEILTESGFTPIVDNSYQEAMLYEDPLSVINQEYTQLVVIEQLPRGQRYVPIGTEIRLVVMPR
jgi:cell division protein FtsI/penicillin-binding protein 2